MTYKGQNSQCQLIFPDIYLAFLQCEGFLGKFWVFQVFHVSLDTNKRFTNLVVACYKPSSMTPTFLYRYWQKAPENTHCKNLNEVSL